MMELIAQGDLSPSAARVAEEAGIGLRTVFRHFDDMDALYAEITATITEEVMPTVMAPYPDQPWQDNIRELDGRRSEEHTSELQSLMRISYAVFCLKKKKNQTKQHTYHYNDE